ncbi:MAG: HAD family phosphatase [Owenweeksia sp.]|nr:HAD family phosphatase [Owenweeksia sp.]
MIKNLILDFGAVLIPIDEKRTWQAFEDLGATPDLKKQQSTFQAYEKGKISSKDFIKKIQPHFFRKNIFPGDLEKAWNAMLYTSLQDEIIQLLRKLGKDYRLYLLSNTNELHISHIRQVSGHFRYHQFTRQFEKIYFSHKAGMRKPEKQLFKTLLKNQDLKAEECLFIDDKQENIKAAMALKIESWHFDPKADRIQNIFQKLDGK